MSSSTKKKVVNGLVWKFAERLSSQGVTFIVSVVLARLLSPAEYGVIAIMNIFILIANVFVIGGLNTSLIQKKDADNLDFSTVFYCSLVMSFIVYGVVFGCAPLIADYYKMPELTLLTRVFALSLFVNSYQSVQQAYVSRHMVFKKNFYATFVGTLLSGVIGIVLAYQGFGVWALVIQHLASVVLNTLTLCLIVDWKPEFLFSWERAKSLLDFGIKILGSSLVNTIYKEIRQLLIGLYYTPSDLALFNRGAHLPNLITSNIDNTLRSVLFPAMSNNNDDKHKVKQMLRRAILNSSYVTYFGLTLLAVASKPLIHLLLTDKWIACVPYMQIMCVTYMVMTVSVSNIQALKAIGKSGEVLKLELIKKPVFLIFVFAALPFGVNAIAYTAILNAIYALWTNMGPTAKYLDYSKYEQLKDLLPGFGLALLLAIVVWPISLLPLNAFVIIAIQIIIAIIVYITASVVFKIEAFYYCKSIVTDLFTKNLKRK